MSELRFFSRECERENVNKYFLPLLLQFLSNFRYEQERHTDIESPVYRFWIDSKREGKERVREKERHKYRERD